MQRRWMMGLAIVLGGSVWAQTAAPAAPAAGDKTAGQAKFQLLCASCHGAGGKGDGAASAALTPRPRDLTDAAYMKTRSDADLKKVILEGGAAIGKSPMMPPWKGSLSEQDVTNIVAYVRTFVAQAPAAPAPAPAAPVTPVPAPGK